MPNRILNRIKKSEILIADGAMGTLLFERGLKQGGCPEAMNVDNPEVLVEIADLYRNAGADIVHTNSFGGSPFKLSKYDLADRTEEFNAAAVRLAREGAGDDALISLSVGPCSKLLKPFGDTEPEAMYQGFLRQISAGLDAGADMVTVETMIDLQEATLAIKAAKAADSGIPVMATMTFEKGPRGFFTTMGVDIPSACSGLSEAGADIIGSNCGNGSDYMVEIAGIFAENTKLPIAIQANAGMPVLEGGKTSYPETPGFMADHVEQYRESGVAVIGGCCGTTPEHISAFKQKIQ